MKKNQQHSILGLGLLLCFLCVIATFIPCSCHVQVDDGHGDNNIDDETVVVEIDQINEDKDADQDQDNTCGNGGGGGGGEDQTCSAHSNNDIHSDKQQELQQQQQQRQQYVFPGCRFYLAPTTVPMSNADIGGGDLGLFTTRSLKRGQPISFPDIIIQMIDYPTRSNDNDNDNDSYVGNLIEQYSWDAQKFGGQNEGRTVASILPGIGSLAKPKPTFQTANTIPYRPDVDEANVPRTTKAGAGSFTHYHNLTFFASRAVDAGGEIFIHVDYLNDPWYQNRTVLLDEQADGNDNNKGTAASNHVRNVDWLNKNGICLDNIKPGKSKIKGAGRGAFATRFIPKGSVIAPIPFIVIPNRNALLMLKRGGNSKKKTTKKQQKQQQQQLLLNYCFGHKNSSVLFFPTSPVANLINHAPTSTSIESSDANDNTGPTANAKIQWSSSSQFNSKEWPKILSIDELKKGHPPSGLLMMEYVATRDIQPKEEVLFNYGQDWIDAWTEHVESWEALPDAKAYTPSYIMEDVAGLLRSEKEQLEHPYAPNLQISCFYQYSVYHDKRNEGILSSSSSSKNTKASGEVTTVKWQMDRRTFEFKNLRPCSVMHREKLPNRQFYYTVMIKNRPGLPENEVIPKEEMHVVNGVPRGAIRFTDKLYTTDQHLPNAFRHEIGIPDEIFPDQWKDRI